MVTRKQGLLYSRVGWRHLQSVGDGHPCMCVPIKAALLTEKVSSSSCLQAQNKHLKRKEEPKQALTEGERPVATIERLCCVHNSGPTSRMSILVRDNVVVINMS
ncbi:hypothetical protein XENORESO_015289 [Xenotaenia resolanae]|uniref:Uncharacterized protein n=1 Tax=Xenotaenia resolanae TaxID=208358 RepID=A0ABV0WZ82_9TELE